VAESPPDERGSDRATIGLGVHVGAGQNQNRSEQELGETGRLGHG
jgi:hypothetical protein